MIIEDGVLVKVDHTDIIDGTVKIPKGVTRIGPGVFSDCGHQLKYVEIPEGVTSIGARAFSLCTSIINIKMPKSVAVIEKQAFAHCFNLESIEIPEGVTQMADSAFESCISLTDVKIPKGVITIGSNAFGNCTRLNSIEIPDGVISIGDKAFDSCTALTNVIIPNSVVSIGDKSFRQCKRLKDIKIPQGVTTIGEEAFCSCSFLTKVELPEGLTAIGSRAFYGCADLRNIDVPETVKTIGRGAFSGCTSLSSIKIPQGIKQIELETFQNCSNLKNVEIPDEVTSIGAGAFSGCRRFTSIKIPNGVKEIKTEAFKNCTYLASIKLPEGITRIGSFAFDDCMELTEIQIPKSVRTIEKGAFQSCCELTSIEIPNGVTTIETNTFMACLNLKIINIPESVTKIQQNAFWNCQELSSIELPNGITSIEDGAFRDCSSLAKIKIPDGVKQIAENTFLCCENLVEVEIPDTVTTIGMNAFSGCTNLMSVKIPESVIDISVGAFSDCRKLVSIEIPEGVTRIGDSAFSGCSSLVSIKIPEGVSNIESNVFKMCGNLQEIILPQNVTCKFLEDLYSYSGLVTKQAQKYLFGSTLEKMQKIKAKANFQHTAEYDEKQMDIFYFRMLNSIGIDEIERMTDIPNLTPEEIKMYSLEKDEAFQNLYDTKYKITGDLGITLQLLKNLQLGKKGNEKNNFEMKLFKCLNQKLEEGYKGTITDLVSSVIQDEQITIEPEFLEKIKEIERSTNKSLIKGNLAKVENQIRECLKTSSEKYPEPIVEMQIVPIKAMIEDTIIDIFKEEGNIDLKILKTRLEEKVSSARAQYIVQKKEQIVYNVLQLFENEEFTNILNYSCMKALSNTKQAIGGAWKYRLNQSLKQLGYTFDNLPENFTPEEIRKISEQLNIQIQSNPIAVPKEGLEREDAYELLRKKRHPSIITYKQIHDMFGSVHEPYSEEFKEFFKKHRKEFLQNPEYYDKFGQIHNNFEMIINSPELKNIYEKGELSIDAILGYLEERSFANQRPGDEELAKLARSVGQISTDKQFEYVQKIFDITKKRERTTIPPITVTKSKYRGRMLSPDDVLNLFAGNITTCCQKFGDIGEGSMILGSIEENAGIFVIEELDENGCVKNIIGQSLTIRQKGVDGAYDRLTFDNIEISREALKALTKQDQEQILEIYQQAGKQAIEKDKKFLGKLLKQEKITQEQYDRLVLKEVVAGTGYNDLQGLKALKRAKIVVADEAHYKYPNGYAWIDSAGGRAPQGSKDGIPVILAQMDEAELAQIKERQESNLTLQTKSSDVPLWYGKIGKVQTLSKKQISEDVVQQIKQIEKTVFREGQQILNNKDVQDAEDINNVYGVPNMSIKLGSNKDWYLIYGDYGPQITISDLAVIGGLNAQNNTNIADGSSKNTPKLAIAEASNELYALLIDAAQQGKKVYCNATSDTSLVNITRSLRKGLIEIKTMEGQDIQYVKGKGLVYAENGELVETRNWNED